MRRRSVAPSEVVSHVRSKIELLPRKRCTCVSNSISWHHELSSERALHVILPTARVLKAAPSPLFFLSTHTPTTHFDTQQRQQQPSTPPSTAFTTINSLHSHQQASQHRQTSASLLSTSHSSLRSVPLTSGSPWLFSALHVRHQTLKQFHITTSPQASITITISTQSHTTSTHVTSSHKFTSTTTSQVQVHKHSSHE
jgi:hypothetical protein